MGKHWKPSKVNILDPTWKGIFVTCNRGREAQCAREIREWFEQAAETLYSEIPDADLKPHSKPKEEVEASVEDDIASAIANEVEQLKSSKKLIVVHDKLGVECVLFVQTRYPLDPVKLALYVTEECMRKERHAKYVQKLSPVQKFVKFDDDESTGNMEKLAPTISTLTPECSFAIRPSLRLCKQTRDDVIPQIAKLVGPTHKVDLKNYDELVVIEGFKSLLGASVINLNAEEMKKRCQLNLCQLAALSI